MKRVFAFFLCFILCFCVFGLNNDDIAFLKSLDSFSGSSLSGSYSQIKGVSGSTRTLTTTGRVLISPEDGIAWLAEKPYESKLIVAKDHLTQQVRKNNPTRLDVSGNEIYTSIATALECVFFGDFDTMQKVFNAELSKSGSSWVLLLKPREKSLSSFISRIEIDGSDCLESLCMYEATGDKIVYSFENLVPGELNGEEKAVYSL